MYQAHSETSKGAFDALSSTDKQHTLVLTALDKTSAVGLTAGQLAERLAIQTGTMAARLIELERSKKIIKLRMTRKNTSGREGHVYVHSRYKEHFTSYELAAPKTNQGNKGVEAPDLTEVTAVLKAIKRNVDMRMDIPRGGTLYRRLEKAISTCG